MLGLIMINRQKTTKKELEKAHHLGVVRRRIEDIHDRMVWSKLWESP